jgi:hypothetical protein
MEGLAKKLDIKKGLESKDFLVSLAMNSICRKKTSSIVSDYEDEDGYEAYPDFDYTEDI